jgi:large subunit ribosomal protein L28
MANLCDVCGKGAQSGHAISHSHIRTKRKWLPNVTSVRVRNDKGTPSRVNVCMKCLSANKVIKAY